MITRFSPPRFFLSPTISFPPCLLLAPTPVREHSGMGTTDGTHFAGCIFYFPRSLYSILQFTTFFHSMGESIQSMPSVPKHCVLNPNLTDGSKNEVCHKVCRWALNLCYPIPPSVSDGAVRSA